MFAYESTCHTSQSISNDIVFDIVKALKSVRV